MTRDEWVNCDDPGRILDFIDGRVDPLVARRFACKCVRNIWDRVLAQEFVSKEVIAQCCSAVEMTERSTSTTMVDAELAEIDFDVITDGGNEAFIAAAHVGWNLFAPINGLHVISEFQHAKEIASLSALAGGSMEQNYQARLMRELVPYPP